MIIVGFKTSRRHYHTQSGLISKQARLKCFKCTCSIRFAFNLLKWQQVMGAFGEKKKQMFFYFTGNSNDQPSEPSSWYSSVWDIYSVQTRYRLNAFDTFIIGMFYTLEIVVFQNMCLKSLCRSILAILVLLCFILNIFDLLNVSQLKQVIIIASTTYRYKQKIHNMQHLLVSFMCKVNFYKTVYKFAKQVW